MNKENLMEKYTKFNSNDVEIRFYKDNLDSIKKYYCIGQPKKSYCKNKCKVKYLNLKYQYIAAKNKEFKTCKAEINFLALEDKLLKKI